MISKVLVGTCIAINGYTYKVVDAVNKTGRTGRGAYILRQKAVIHGERGLYDKRWNAKTVHGKSIRISCDSWRAK